MPTTPAAIASRLGPTELAAADVLVTQSIYLLRYANGLDARIVGLLAALRERLLAEVVLSADNAVGALTDVEKLIQRAEAAIEAAYHEVKGVAEDGMKGAADVHTDAAVLSLTAAASATPDLTIRIGSVHRLPDSVMASITREVLIEGAYSADWWKSQGDDMARRFAIEVRQGMHQGDTTYAIAQRVRPIIDKATDNARRIVHQSVQAAANHARRETFKANGDIVRGLLQISTLDNRTSDVCLAYSGGTWTLEGKPIAPTTLPYKGGCPRHWNCRSVEVPILKTFREQGFNVDEPELTTRASIDGPVNANLSMQQWLETKDDAFTDELMGKGRAQLWRDGKITLQDLVNAHGDPLTLDQIRARVRRRGD